MPALVGVPGREGERVTEKPKSGAALMLNAPFFFLIWPIHSITACEIPNSEALSN